MMRAVLLLGVAGFCAPAFGQILNINPTCGPTGTVVKMTGSGWEEPQPICHYNFLFDGATFAPQQPDGLYGPPNGSGTVPASAALGNHTIKVELRLDSDNSLLQCRQDTFKVVTSSSDPFDGGNNVNPGGAPTYGAGNIKVTFNPTNACKVTPCTDITMIQVMQQLGVHADGSTVILNYSQQNLPASGPKFNDADITAAGWAVDSAAASPYYSAAYAGTDGNQSKSQTSAVLIDRVTNALANFPADATITSVTINFEDNFFCAAGENRGEFLGMATWTWTKTRASATGPGGNVFGTVTAHSAGNQNQPSQAALDALSLFNKNHSFMFPTIAPKQLPPGQGGQSCQ